MKIKLAHCYSRVLSGGGKQPLDVNICPLRSGSTAILIGARRCKSRDACVLDIRC